MSQEKRKVISLILEKFDIPLHKGASAEIIYSEPGMMHTIKIDNTVYKGLYYEDEWKITQMK